MAVLTLGYLGSSANAGVTSSQPVRSNSAGCRRVHRGGENMVPTPWKREKGPTRMVAAAFLDAKRFRRASEGNSVPRWRFGLVCDTNPSRQRGFEKK